MTGGNSLWIGVRAKGQALPWPSGPDVALEPWRWDPRGGGGGQGLPPPSRSFGPFTGFRFLPADASGACRPDPKANHQTCSVPPSGHGCFGKTFSLRARCPRPSLAIALGFSGITRGIENERFDLLAEINGRGRKRRESGVVAGNPRQKKGRPARRPELQTAFFYNSAFPCIIVGVMKSKSSRLTFRVS